MTTHTVGLNRLFYLNYSLILIILYYSSLSLTLLKLILRCAMCVEYESANFDIVGILAAKAREYAFIYFPIFASLVYFITQDIAFNKKCSLLPSTPFIFIQIFQPSYIPPQFIIQPSK